MAAGDSSSRSTRTQLSRTAAESSPLARSCRITSSPYLSATRPGSSSASLKHKRQASFCSSSNGLRRRIAARSRVSSNASHAASSIASRETSRRAICEVGL
jgi:hypothetical protein